MFIRKTLVRRILPPIGLLFSLGLVQVCAQEEESPAEKQYREDYERYNKIASISDSTKRSEALLLMIKERPDSKLVDYCDKNYLLILESFSKAEKYPVVITLAEKFIKLRPRVGETYYFYGGALKNSQRIPEAVDALAKCSVIKNNASRKAREFLEFLYKSQNKGSAVGLEKLLKKAQDELNK